MNIAGFQARPLLTTKPGSLRDQDWKDAGAMLEQRGVDLREHQVMQENLATYLSHRSSGTSSARWQHKIDRELAQPYTDAEVAQQLDKLEDSLQENLRDLPARPSRIFLTGSLVKGRLGANSDLDGFAVLAPKDIPAGFDSYEKREGLAEAANLFPFSEATPGYNKAHLMIAGKSIEVTPEQAMTDGFLTEIYQGVLDRRSDRRETHPVFEWASGKVWGEEKSAADKRAAFDSDSIGTRVQSMIMSLGGTLSMVPLVGAVVNGVADFFVRQSHLDFTESN